MTGFDDADPGYRALYERALVVLGADARVDSVRLGGSLASGTADRWSDLDIHVVTRTESYDEFLNDWRAWLVMITPTVFARTPMAPFIINTVTADGLTFDVAVHAGTLPAVPAAPNEYVVGMLSSRRFAAVGDALEYAVAEQLRGLIGPFISLVKRDEHLRHLTGIPHLLGLLTAVFLAETGAPPPAKHWNRTFTAEQRGAVAALPPVSATREGIVGFGLGVAKLVVTRARPLFPRYGLTWPDDLAAVTSTRLRSCLDIDTQDWLY